jgi:uncharacterized protein (UPF0216 family)
MIEFVLVDLVVFVPPMIEEIGQGSQAKAVVVTSDGTRSALYRDDLERLREWIDETLS